MSNFKFDNHGELPTGMQEITNTSSESERVLTEADYQKAWDAIRAAAKPAIEHTLRVWEELRRNWKLMEMIAQENAITQGNRYWHDHQGQPRRTPGKRPLLQNGKAPR